MGKKDLQSVVEDKNKLKQPALVTSNKKEHYFYESIEVIQSY